ncbi:hypothetical protein [Limnochorda pilosa]|nr:hypothetical protein [Limnochorda pilosa]
MAEQRPFIPLERPPACRLVDKTALLGHDGEQDAIEGRTGPVAAAGRAGRAHAGLRSRGGGAALAPVKPRWEVDEFDALEDVDAAFRAMRRLLLRYVALFAGVVLGIPVLSILAPWWYRMPVLGGMTANFAAVAVGIHVVYVAMGLLFERSADRLERAMLGQRQAWPPGGGIQGTGLGTDSLGSPGSDPDRQEDQDAL